MKWAEMRGHLERRLRLRVEEENKSLYRWAIDGINAEGKRVGADQIPWDWTLNFTATSCVLRAAKTRDVISSALAPTLDIGTRFPPELYASTEVREWLVTLRA